MQQEGNIYTPVNLAPGRTVVCNGEALDKCLDIYNHSPSGFNWGYGGSGPAQLALAIMVNEFGRDLDRHPVHYQSFKWSVVANLPENSADWQITSKDIEDAIVKILAEQEQPADDPDFPF